MASARVTSTDSGFFDCGVFLVSGRTIEILECGVSLGDSSSSFPSPPSAPDSDRQNSKPPTIWTCRRRPARPSLVDPDIIMTRTASGPVNTPAITEVEEYMLEKSDSIPIICGTRSTAAKAGASPTSFTPAAPTAATIPSNKGSRPPLASPSRALRRVSGVRFCFFPSASGVPAAVGSLAANKRTIDNRVVMGTVGSVMVRATSSRNGLDLALRTEYSDETFFRESATSGVNAELRG